MVQSRQSEIPLLTSVLRLSNHLGSTKTILPVPGSNRSCPVSALRAEWRRDSRTTMATVSHSRGRGFLRRLSRHWSALVGRRGGVLVVERLVGVRDARSLVTTLDAKDYEEDPGDQLADSADCDAGDAAVEHARVCAGVVRRAVRAVRAV